MGLVALAAARKVNPQLVPLEQLQALGRFALFLQREDGSFVHKYRAESGPVSNWESLSYPGEAALGFIELYETDHSPEWLAAAGKALSLWQEPHWAFVCSHQPSGIDCDHQTRTFCDEVHAPFTGRTRGACGPSVRIDSTRSIQGISSRGLGWRIQSHWPHGSSRYAIGGSSGVADVSAEERVARQIEVAAGRGITFLLRAQIVSGPEASGIPGAIIISARDSSQIRIDYVQHALCAWLQYKQFISAR